MDVIDELPPGAPARESLEKKVSAIKALVQLVEDSEPVGKAPLIKDPAAWVHTAFYTYRSAMADNDPTLPRLARMEHDFIAALVALNFDDQRRQLRRALVAMLAFPKAPG